MGTPPRHHLELLRRRTPLPLLVLFNIDRGSSEYNEGTKRGILYAQSWALVHWLMLGEKAQRQPLLVQFIGLLNEGAESASAFEQAFGL